MSYVQYVIFCIGDAHDKGKQTRYHNHHYHPHQQENLTWLKTLYSFQIARFCLKHPVECVESVVVNRKHHQLIWSQKIPCRDQDILTSQSLGSLFIMNSALSNSFINHMAVRAIPLSPKPQVFCPHAYGQISDNMACSLDSGVLGFLLSVLHFVWFCLVWGEQHLVLSTSRILSEKQSVHSSLVFHPLTLIEASFLQGSVRNNKKPPLSVIFLSELSFYSQKTCGYFLSKVKNLLSTFLF